MDLKALKEALKALHAKMIGLNDEMAKLGKQARDETDKGKAEGVRSVFASKKTEFDAAKAEMEDLKNQMAQLETIGEVEELSRTDTEGKQINPPNQPGAKTAEVIQTPLKDANRDERDHRGFFLDFVSGKALSDQALAHIAVKPGTRLHSLDERGVRLPKSMAQAIITGRPNQFAKTILSSDSVGGSTDSGAANLIAPNFIPQVIYEPIWYPTLYDLVRKVPADNGKATYPRLDTSQGNFGGVAFTWKAAEGLDKGETEPVFGNWEVVTHEVSGWTAISLQALRRSSVDMESFLTELFRSAAKYEFSRVILAGNGTTQPQGILIASINKITRVTLNQVEYNDLVNLSYGVKKGMRAGGIYIAADDVEQFLVGSLDGVGRPLFTASVASGPVDRMAGYRYETHDFDSPVLGEEGDIVFGNPNFYGFGVEEDIAIAKSEHAEFKKGLVVFRLMAHVGGKPLINEAFCELDNLAT